MSGGGFRARRRRAAAAAAGARAARSEVVAYGKDIRVWISAARICTCTWAGYIMPGSRWSVMCTSRINTSSCSDSIRLVEALNQDENGREMGRRYVGPELIDDDEDGWTSAHDEDGCRQTWSFKIVWGTRN
jgi:hypothetical protein